jgi:hypothetical protein
VCSHGAIVLEYRELHGRLHVCLQLFVHTPLQQLAFLLADDLGKPSWSPSFRTAPSRQDNGRGKSTLAQHLGQLVPGDSRQISFESHQLLLRNEAREFAESRFESRHMRATPAS